MCCIWIAVGFESTEKPLLAAAHRGPDGQGETRFLSGAGPVCLGHRRLSIYDLSDSGAQPMQSADGRYTLVLNGAIYNFRQIQAELQAKGVGIETDSDTAVLLAAWRHWGQSAIVRLNGMFAFAVYDAAEQSLTLVRDRFGEKPLHFAAWRENGRVCFAASSEIPQLLAARPELAELNTATAADFVNVGATDWSDGTFFKSISRLPAASCLTISLADPLDAAPDPSRADTWWTPPPVDRALGDPRIAAEALRPLLRDAVDLRLIADVPVGACLSGGLDSSGILGMAKSLDAPALTCITAQFDESTPDGTDLSERPYVNALEQVIPFNRITVTPTDEALADCLDQVIDTQAEPFASTSICTQWFVFRAARKAGLKAMLDGQGADELFGGYPGMAGFQLADEMARANLLGWYRSARALSEEPSDLNMRGLFRSTYSALLPETARRGIGRLRGSWPPRPWLIPSGLPPRRPHIAGKSRFDGLVEAMITSISLPSLLRYEDRNAMAWGVESRLPYLDAHVTDLALRIPGAGKIADGETKRPLRLALKGMIPDSIVHRRRKLGFSTPEQRWIAGPLAPMLADAQRHLADSFGDLVDTDETANVFANAGTDGVNAGRAFRLLVLSRWAERFRVTG